MDTPLFVRPTESLPVFTQEIGRGLRLSERKSHCAVIDLIGNYRNADVKLQLLAEPMEGDGKKAVAAIPSAPAGCVLELETAVVNLLEELSRKRMPLRDRLHRAFLDLRNELGRVPTYLELHLHGREDSKGYAQTFGSYAGFLSWAGSLTAEEQAAYEASEEWLRDVEKTAMAKSYKMFVLMYMLERGAERLAEPVIPEEIAPFFHRYLMEKEHRKRIDFSDAESGRLWAYDEAAVSGLIARMPMTKWAGARGSMTRFEDGVFSLVHAPVGEHRAIVHRWTREICEYRLHVHFERRS